MRRFSDFLPRHDNHSKPVNPREAQECWEREKNAKAAATSENYYKHHHHRVSARIDWMHIHSGNIPLDRPTPKQNENRKKRITLPKIHWDRGGSA